MRILIATTAYFPASNGQAIFTENLAVGLAKRGHEVLAVMSSNRGRPYRAQYRGITVEGLRSITAGALHAGSGSAFLCEKEIRKIIDSFRPEIVHIQDHYPVGRDATKIARQRGIKVIGSNHFMPENLAQYFPVVSAIKPLYNRMMWNWMLEVYNQVDVVTAQSRASAELVRLQGLRPPVFPVSCGIDTTRFHPDPQVDRAALCARYGIDPNRKVFLFVGRIDREKRLDVLLHALSILDRNDIQLVLAGQGMAAPALHALCRQLKLGDRVHFTGMIPNEDLPALLNSADIFTMPSEAELLSIASLEAMASARPVLLANAVALPELCTDDVNGYLFQPGDARDAARCMALLADHPERWAEMGTASLEKARQHSLDNILQKYESLYEQLLAGSSVLEAQSEEIPAPKPGPQKRRHIVQRHALEDSVP
jgi:glycosyltransferase involved in cell wall biosynthesis